MVLAPSAAAQAGLAATRAEDTPAFITHMDRTVIHGDIVHYRYDVKVGRGEHDRIWLHRVVKERYLYRPVHTLSSLFLLPGSPNFFESIFVEPLISQVPAWDQSIATYLAKNDIDVWGMDYRWATVPAETSNFTFMKDWGIQKDADDTEAALSLARVIRLMTGQGYDRIHLLGFSYGGFIGYTVAGDESQKPHGFRNVKGLVNVDAPLKFEEQFIRDYRCSLAATDQATLDAGIYNDDSGLFFGQVAGLAMTAPNDPSPIIPGLTNYQAPLFISSRYWLLAGDPIFWHFNAGAGKDFVAPDYIPSSMLYTEPQLSLDLDQALPPHLPTKSDFDVDAVMCGIIDVPFDDHLGQIELPILYVGAGGGFGKYGYYTTSLTASKDITKFTVQFQPDDQRMLDFGHADLFTAKYAQTLVWKPILDWLVAHH